MTRSEGPEKGKLLISFIRGKTTYGRWVGRRIHLPHGSLSLTKRRALRLAATIPPAAILVPPPKPNQKVLEKRPQSLETCRWPCPRKKKQTHCPNKVFFLQYRGPLSDWESVEVSDILRSALLQSVATKLSKLPPSSFPVSPSVFSETYILPYRSFKEVSATSTPVDIKHSGYKSLTAFLKASAKEGLIRVKEIKGEVVVTGAYRIYGVRVHSLKSHTGVNQSHSSVDGHLIHVTVKDVEEKEERKEERERQEERKAKEKGRELQVTLLWKPHMGNVLFFKEAGREWVRPHPHPDDVTEHNTTRQPRRSLYSGGDQVHR